MYKTKAIVTTLLISTMISACGGGSSGSSRDGEASTIDSLIESSGSDSSPIEGDTTSLTVSEEDDAKEAPLAESLINKDNYIRRASWVYKSTYTLGTLTAHDPEFDLIHISGSIDKGFTTDCDKGGSRSVEIHRTPFEEKTLHPGDYLLETQSSCDSTLSIYIDSGTERTTITSLEGKYDSNSEAGYILELERVKDIYRIDKIIESATGDYSYNLRYTLGEQDFGEIEWYGMNLSKLYRGAPPSEGEHRFSEAISVESTPLPTGPADFEDPSRRYDTFAFDLLEDNTGEYERRQVAWYMDLFDKKEPALSYSTETLEALVIETRSKIDEEGEEEAFFFGVQGHIRIQYDSGERIDIRITEPDASIDTESKGVVVTLDEDGDGKVDASTPLTWQQFEVGFAGLIF